MKAIYKFEYHKHKINIEKISYEGDICNIGVKLDELVNGGDLMYTLKSKEEGIKLFKGLLVVKRISIINGLKEKIKKYHNDIERIEKC